MFARKNSNLLFLTNTKHIRDDSSGFRTSRTARKQSVELVLRKIKKQSTEQNLIKKEEFLDQKIQIQPLIELKKNNTLRQLDGNVNSKLQELRSKRKQLEFRCKDVDQILKKLLNTDNIVAQEPQTMKELRIYNPYYRSETELPRHLKQTFYDPDKYSHFYDNLQKNVKFPSNIQRALLEYKKNIVQKQQRIPNFIKNLPNINN